MLYPEKEGVVGNPTTNQVRRCVKLVKYCCWVFWGDKSMPRHLFKVPIPRRCRRFSIWIWICRCGLWSGKGRSRAICTFRLLRIEHVPDHRLLSISQSLGKGIVRLWSNSNTLGLTHVSDMAQWRRRERWWERKSEIQLETEWDTNTRFFAQQLLFQLTMSCSGHHLILGITVLSNNLLTKLLRTFG